MHSCYKSTREIKNPTNQSFSSSLLDEIYREIDGGVDETHMETIKQNKEKNVKKLQGGGWGGRAKGRSSIENEEMSSLKKACLLEKWMEQKVNEKALARGRVSLVPQFDHKLMQDNDPLFFSSSSCSSDSSFGGFSSSETESFGAGKIRTVPNVKSIRTNVRSDEAFGYSVAQGEQQSEFYLFDDYRNPNIRDNHQTNKRIGDGGLVKSKARAQKIYANLKKIKQPISPGGRLASFINSIFTNGNPKKSREGNGNDVNAGWNSKSTQTSTCSSASSFSRSCLSKNSPNSRQKRNNGIKRSVRFYPVSVIVDEDCRPCGHKCIYEEEADQQFKKPPMPRHQTNLRQPTVPVVDHKRNDVSRSCENLKENDFVATINGDEDYDFEDDCASDSSSDLFELDHLASFKDDRYCEDLPVYETTHLGLNRAIANGLIS
ncbi:Ankyrin repeat-containing protein [Heracleum sosnowskyi]|uniref:Ankyrin repeat-containing protein n=1 Tax=Heracleum sosnowskyi TaxID=360622 RepID=A0AAD8HLK8_9APIA|nr:Ankyrin repeat-containing protein [Heracleum sosnowskyi]